MAFIESQIAKKGKKSQNRWSRLPPGGDLFVHGTRKEKNALTSGPVRSEEGRMGPGCQLRKGEGEAPARQSWAAAAGPSSRCGRGLLGRTADGPRPRARGGKQAFRLKPERERGFVFFIFFYFPLFIPKPFSKPF